jgi:hypothetical protein
MGDAEWGCATPDAFGERPFFGANRWRKCDTVSSIISRIIPRQMTMSQMRYVSATLATANAAAESRITSAASTRTTQ